MISYAEALALIHQQLATLASEWVDSADAQGRVLAQALSSPAELPAFDNSAMDGFALVTDGRGAMTASEYAVSGSVAAGEDAGGITAGAAWEIMTGAGLPVGTDAVVPIEQVELLAHDGARPSRIRLRADVRVGQHIRRRGEDVALHDRVIEAGTVLRGAHLMLLAGLGCARVQVVRRPRVALIATGRELVGDPAQPLQPGQIRDGTSSYLLSQLHAAGAELVWRGQVGDDAAAFDAALAQARHAGADVILAPARCRVVATISCRMRWRDMGRRCYFIRWRCGQASRCCWRALRKARCISVCRATRWPALPDYVFVEPALRSLLGMPAERGLRVALHTPMHARPIWRRHLRARLNCSDAGVLRVQILPQQESFRVAPLLQANVWAVLEPQDDGAAPSTTAQVFGLGHLQPAAPAITP